MRDYFNADWFFRNQNSARSFFSTLQFEFYAKWTFTRALIMIN